MIEFSLDKKQFEALKLRMRVVSPKERGNVITVAFRALTIETERYLKEDILSSQVLNVRTGRLRSSISSVLLREGDNIHGIVGSGVRQGDRVPYANIHETGGTITPRVSKYLAIPLPPALTPAGVLKKKPREWQHTFVMRSNSGNLIIYQKQGKLGKGALVALFLLKKSVKIPARYYMTKTVDAMSDKALDIMSKSIERQIEGKRI